VKISNYLNNKESMEDNAV